MTPKQSDSAAAGQFSTSTRARVVLVSLLLATVLGMSGCNQALQGFTPTSNNTTASDIVISANVPPATKGTSYSAVLSVQGGSAPYHFWLRSGTLPPGLNLNRLTGSISGNPSASGAFHFDIAVTDRERRANGSRTFTLLVGNSPDTAKVQIEITPLSTSVKSTGKLQFSASTRNTSNTAVKWSTTAGWISTSGMFTAPSVSGTKSVTVTATSVADPKAQASATVAVSADSTTTSSLTIGTSSLPGTSVGNPYAATLAAAGGTTPYAWSVVSGTLPAGLSLDPSSGTLSGTTSADGTFSFTAQVADSAGSSASKPLSIAVAASTSASGFDGPAELPRQFVKSALSDTPASGGTAHVNAGGNLQAALDAAHCGDTIELQAGATFSGYFTLPAKACDDDHWIVVRTSAPDTSLPAEGTRMTPCYAGFGSLPNRPAFACTNAENVLAKIVYPQPTGSGPLFLADGANHYRLIGLEITRTPGTGSITHLLSIRKDGAANHIVLDRVWMHGTSRDETKSGVHLSGVAYAAVVDSYFSDFHCVSTSGACTDAQAINGGTGSHVGGPYKIVNNFLEASTEAILMGGGAATTTPTDIEIRRNHFYKPMQWKKGIAGFVGAANGNPFTVKNHLELKNAQRVLVEGNLMENTWGGFSQAGFSILLTPKNQHMGTTNVCPICQVTDVTIRYNKMSHAGGGMQIANGISGDGTNGDQALAGARYSIHDVVIDDIRADYFTGSGTLFQISNGWTNNVLNSVSISHVTGFPDPKSHMLSIGNVTSNPTMWGFTFTNNVVLAGAYPVWSTGGGTANCAYSDVPNLVLQACFTSYTFANNGILAATAAFSSSRWPAGNYLVADPATLFVNYKGGDYHLVSSGAMRSASTTDGRDIGADIDGIAGATEGID